MLFLVTRLYCQVPATTKVKEFEHQFTYPSKKIKYPKTKYLKNQIDIMKVGFLHQKSKS